MSRTPSLQLITDAVVAEYIHEISERHSVSEPERGRPEAESGPGPAPGVDDGERMAA